VSINVIAAFLPVACDRFLRNGFKQFDKTLVPDYTFKINVVLFTFLSFIFWDLYFIYIY
jgi:hypothetical protein